MPTTFRVRMASHTIVAVIGDVDAATAGALAAELADPAIEAADLSAVSYMGAAGLRVLLEANDSACRPAGLRLIAPSRPIVRLLEVSGCGARFPSVA
jgi:anti-anti-sigma factor